MNIHKLTTVGRPIDLSYRSNRAIAVGSLLVMLGAVILQRAAGSTWTHSVLWSAQAALSVFLAWALCRELDPDHDGSALLAAGLCLGGLILWGLPRLTVIFWLNVVVRAVNRTTGVPAGFLDSMGMLGLGIWLSLQANLGYGFITSVAFFLDSQLPDRAPGQLVFALLSIAATVAATIVGEGVLWDGTPHLGGTLIALTVSILLLPAVRDARSLKAVGDRTGKRLEPHRVQAAQLIALITGVGTAFLGGIPALGALVPLWTAVLGASVHWLYRALMP